MARSQGHPHSEDMKLHEVYRHPDAMTLEITMTIDDPKAYTKPWVGAKQTLKLELPKGLTVRYESLLCTFGDRKLQQRDRRSCRQGFQCPIAGDEQQLHTPGLKGDWDHGFRFREVKLDRNPKPRIRRR